MSSHEIHLKKYEMFKKDGLNKDNPYPTRIEALFESIFHLIECCCSIKRIHINKHKLVRDILTENKDIFRADTEFVWQSFQEIENQIRPGQAYGGKINGEQYQKAKMLFNQIEDKCLLVLRKVNKYPFRNTQQQ